MKERTAKSSFFVIALTLVAVTSGEALAYKVGEADLSFRGSLTETYDDNVTYRAVDEIDDLVSSANAGANLDWEGRTRVVSLRGDIRRNLYWDNGDFDNTSGEVKVLIDNEFSRFDRVTILEEFSVSEEPRSLDDAFGGGQGRFKRYNNTLGFDYTREITKNFALRSYYTNLAQEYTVRTQADSMLHDLGLDGIVALSSETAVILGYEFLNRRFDDLDLDATTHSGTVGVRQSFTDKLYLDARLGVDFIESFDKRDFEKPFMSASLTHEWLKTTRSTVSFFRRFDTTGYSQSLLDRWRVSGSLSHELTKRLSASASAFYGEGEYVGALKEDELAGGSLGLAYDLTKDWKGTVRYSVSEQDSTLATDKYSKNLFSFGVSAEF